MRFWPSNETAAAQTDFFGALYAEPQRLREFLGAMSGFSAGAAQASIISWKGDYPRNDTSVALAAGTSTINSWPVNRTSSFICGAHLPSSSTLAPPSVTAAVASMAGPASRSMDATVNLGPRSIATRSSRVMFWLMRQTRNVPSGARTANALRPLASPPKK